MTVVVDTGPLYALADRRDRHHAACRDWYLKTDPRRLIIPAPVLAEACHLIERSCGSQVEAAFLEDLGRGSYGTVVTVEPVDLIRAGALVRQHAQLPLGGTDAMVIAVAERLRVPTVATVDWRHFNVVRPAHVPAFTIVPGSP